MLRGEGQVELWSLMATMRIEIRQLSFVYEEGTVVLSVEICCVEGGTCIAVSLSS
jgi:hypothetical protein